jgi:hypothetical protein
MTKKELHETLRSLFKDNQPTPSKPKPKISPTIHPDRLNEKPGPRRPFIKPNIQPKPKATMMKESEKEMLDKIVKRFKSKK